MVKAYALQARAGFLRNFIFGVEDSLVSTVGLLSGVAVADVDKKTILLAGIVLIFVEAFSMGVGSYLSEIQEAGYLKKKRDKMRPIMDGLIMFGSYFLTGFLPLSPYLALPREVAFWTSIFFALAALFLLGFAAARIAKVPLLQNALRMLVVGGTAVVLGVGVGLFVSAI